MRRFEKPAFLAAVVCFLLLIALPASADSQVRIVRLSNVQGSVQIDRQTGQGFEKAILNMPITQGTVLSTGADGRVEVEFEDGTVIHSAPASEITFQQLSLRSSGDKASSIAVQQGTVYFNVRRKGGDEFSVASTNRLLQVSKPVRFRVIVDREHLRLAVLDGDLSLPDSSGQIKVKKGQELTLNRADGQYATSYIQPGEFDTWARERLAYHDRYYSASSYKSYPYFGRGDLGYYGGWYEVPGYGSIWRPNNVGFGWDPFSDGHWAWYPGSGFLWVSNHPWGWLPYRYGSWAYVAGWGWGWLPYGNWNNWRSSPGIINTPPGYQRPDPPNPPGSTNPPSVSKPDTPPIYVAKPPRGPRDTRRQDDGPRAILPKQTPSNVVLAPAAPPRLEREHDGIVRPHAPRRPIEPRTGPRGTYRPEFDGVGAGRPGFQGGGRTDSGFGGTSPQHSAPSSGGVAPMPSAPRSEPAQAPRSAPERDSGRNTR